MYGLYQATYWSIKESLLNYAKSKGASIGDRDMQVDHFLKLMQEDYPAIWKVLTTAKTVREASDAVLLKFERPADQSEVVQLKRAEYGEEFFEKYGTATPSAPAEEKPVSTGCTAEKLIAVAIAELGYKEKASNYYRKLITANPDMELVGIYGDKARTGLKKTSRPGLQCLLKDCRAGKINLILTKSISRFARNMAECAEMIRELRSLGVNVLFEEQNLNSQDTKSDLILNIFAAIAEEESHSISQHTTKAHEQYTLEGRPFGRISFGYYNAGNNRWAINEEEAIKVRTAFQLAGEGKSYSEIRKALNAMETDEYKWRKSRLKRMLTNVVYKGDYFSHATVCLVPGKQVENKGYRDRFYLEGHHEPIVPPELFDRVQEMIASGALDRRIA